MPFNPNTFKSADVQSLLENYRAGTPLLEKEDIPDIGTVDENQTPEEKPKPSLYRDSMFMPIRRGVAESNIDEALSEGFGTSRYDDDFYSGMDLENSRALAQSGFSKIGTGLGKMATTAVTTALNTTLGTVFGVGSAMFELAGMYSYGIGVKQDLQKAVDLYSEVQGIACADFVKISGYPNMCALVGYEIANIARFRASLEQNNIPE